MPRLRPRRNVSPPPPPARHDLLGAATIGLRAAVTEWELGPAVHTVLNTFPVRPGQTIAVDLLRQGELIASCEAQLRGRMLVFADLHPVAAMSTAGCTVVITPLPGPSWLPPATLMPTPTTAYA